MSIIIVLVIITVWIKAQEVKWQVDTEDLYPLHYRHPDSSK